jgi:hypothetical protein
MVSLQFLLVDIMKRHEIKQVFKKKSVQSGKNTCVYVLFRKIVNYGQWLIFYSDI